MSRYPAYRKWHEWESHQRCTCNRTQRAYSFAVLTFLLVSYQRVAAASDLFNSWNFSVIGDFTISGGVEADGSTVRLKAQGYASDSNTKALYHLDESSRRGG